MKIRSIIGPWLSLGVHLDFKHRRIEIHFIWWVITIGNTKEEIYCGACGKEMQNVGDICDCWVHNDIYIKMRESIAKYGGLVEKE